MPHGSNALPILESPLFINSSPPVRLPLSGSSPLLGASLSCELPSPGSSPLLGAPLSWKLPSPGSSPLQEAPLSWELPSPSRKPSWLHNDWCVKPPIVFCTGLWSPALLAIACPPIQLVTVVSYNLNSAAVGANCKSIIECVLASIQQTHPAIVHTMGSNTIHGGRTDVWKR